MTGRAARIWLNNIHFRFACLFYILICILWALSGYCVGVLMELESHGQEGPAKIGIKNQATLGSPDTEDDFPAIGCDGEGKVWVCWVAYDGKSDVVLASRLDDASRSSPITLSSEAGDFWRPAMCRDGDGRLWFTWTQNVKGNWDVWARYLAGGKLSKALRLTRGKGNDFCQKLAIDGKGIVWMAWQSVVDGSYEILLARVTPQGLSKVHNVSQHAASDWEPALAATKDGRIFVAWDSYRSGSYDILVREFKSGRFGEILGVAATGAYEAHAALAVDSEDRLWIAWDDGGEKWGKYDKVRRRLHSQREIGIRCLVDGRLFEPVQRLSDVLRGELAKLCELPELIVDGKGRLWLFVRHVVDWTKKRKDGTRRGAQGIWNPYVLCYAGGKWSEPVKLPQSNGRNDMRVANCLSPDGRVWAAWADDGRKETRAEEPVNHNINAAMLSVPDTASKILPVEVLDQSMAAAPKADAYQEKYEHYTLTAGGQTYMLLYGDTHRHTDISRCSMNYDGSLMDTYRYAVDVAKLDFLAITDHDQDHMKHRYDRDTSSTLQHYSWWRSEKYCDLFYIEKRFIPIYAYEHGGSFVARGGHKNVLYLKRGNFCFEQNSPMELFKMLRGRDVVVIPHQLADNKSATDWSKWDPQFERVAEIFQVRGSYEYFEAEPKVTRTRKGNYYWDALAMGVRIGVIASCDHGMVSNAYAGVYSSEVSRQGVMEGLRSRRTFGSMDRIIIEFRLGERLLGEEAEVNAPPEFQIFIKGSVPLRKVQIVKDGQFIHTAHPEGPVYRYRYCDTDLKPGDKSYYYVRCEQENDKYGWSSPIWVQRAK